MKKEKERKQAAQYYQQGAVQTILHTAVINRVEEVKSKPSYLSTVKELQRKKNKN